MQYPLPETIGTPESSQNPVLAPNLQKKTAPLFWITLIALASLLLTAAGYWLTMPVPLGALGGVSLAFLISAWCLHSYGPILSWIQKDMLFAVVLANLLLIAVSMAAHFDLSFLGSGPGRDALSGLFAFLLCAGIHMKKSKKNKSREIFFD